MSENILKISPSQLSICLLLTSVKVVEMKIAKSLSPAKLHKNPSNLSFPEEEAVSILTLPQAMKKYLTIRWKSISICQKKHRATESHHTVRVALLVLRRKVES